MAGSTVMFKMKIGEVFRFQDGRTVLVGPVEGTLARLPACTCELLVNGAKRQEIRIEGEMMPGSPHDQGYRSVSSKDAVQLESEEVATAVCVVQSVTS